MTTTTLALLTVMADGIPREIQEMVSITGLDHETVMNGLRNLRAREYVSAAPMRYGINTVGRRKLATEANKEQRAKAEAEVEDRRTAGRRRRAAERASLASQAAANAMEQKGRKQIATRMPRAFRAPCKSDRVSGESILQSARKQPNSVFALGALGGKGA